MMKHIEKPTNGMYVYSRVALIKARNLCKMNPLNPPRFDLSPEKLRQTKCLLFTWPKHQFLPNCQVPNGFFLGITVNSIIQKLKSKHLVCLSFSDERLNMREFILQKVRAIVSQPGGFPTKPGGVEADQR